MKLSALAVLLLGGFGWAQAAAPVLDLGEGFEKASSAEQAFAKKFSARQASAKSDETLGRVMVSMFDQPGAAADVVGWLRSRNAIVEFSDGLERPSASGYVVDPEHGMVPRISIDSALKQEPSSARYLAALIAKETSGRMLKDSPDADTKRYMIASVAARAFIELGGDKKTLLGVKDPALRAEFKYWLDSREDLREHRRAGELGRLQQEAMQAGNRERSRRLDDAIDEWVQFKKGEVSWLGRYGDRLK